MAIRITKDIYAKVCSCDCGGEVDAFRDQEDGRWYTHCMNCGEIGPKANNWAGAANCYPKHARTPASWCRGAEVLAR